MATFRDLAQPMLVSCGDSDSCAPLPNSEELERLITATQRTVVRCERALIHQEQARLSVRPVCACLARH
jgi:hypothetical protein